MILLLYVKQLNGYLVTHFSGVVFTPSKPFWARKKKYVSLSFSGTTTYVRPKKIGGGHLPNVPCPIRIQRLKIHRNTCVSLKVLDRYFCVAV